MGLGGLKVLFRNIFSKAIQQCLKLVRVLSLKFCKFSYRDASSVLMEYCSEPCI